MVTFTSKYGLGDTVFYVDLILQEVGVRIDQVIAVKHAVNSGTMYMLRLDDNGWHEEERLYATREEAQEHFREERLECYRDDLKYVQRTLAYHERSASDARDQARSLQEKIKKLEDEENGDI